MSDTLAHVLQNEPDWTKLAEATPRKVKELVRRCLRKDSKRRLHDIADARIELEDALTTSTSSADNAEAVPTPQPPAWRTVLPWMVGAAVGSLVTGIAVWSLRSPAPLRLTRFTVAPPAAEAIALANESHDIAISPDGTHLVFKALGARARRFYVRTMARLSATPLEGLGPQAFSPFISPDSTWVGFHDEDDDTLKKVSVLGGPVVPICRTQGSIFGASWGADDIIVFGTEGAGLYRVPAGGGEPEALTTPHYEGGEIAHRWPEVLPNRTGVLFTVASRDAPRIAVLDLKGGESAVLLRSGSYPRYSPTGHIVYGVDGTLWAVPFDLERLAIAGDPVPVLDEVVTKGSGAVGFDLARDGTLAYLSGNVGASQRTLVWVDRDGREESLDVPLRVYHVPRVSPDGTRVVVHVQDDSGSTDLWVFDVAQATMTRLTFDPGLDEMPLWTPDGNRIVFYSTRDRGGLFSKAADGTGAVESLTTGSTPQIPMAWSEDGTKLLTVSRKGGGGIGTFGSSADIGVLAAEGEHSVEWLTKTDFRELRPAISPDGHWMAYDSDASGRSEVYVRPFPNIDDGLWQLSTDGGRSPTWSFDGKELFYRSFAGARAAAMMRVAVQLSPSFSAGPPDVLFEGPYIVGGNDHRMYDLSADGRFLMVVNRATSTQLHVVLNWFEELERLALRP